MKIIFKIFILLGLFIPSISYDSTAGSHDFNDTINNAILGEENEFNPNDYFENNDCFYIRSDDREVVQSLDNMKRRYISLYNVSKEREDNRYDEKVYLSMENIIKKIHKLSKEYYEKALEIRNSGSLKNY